MYSCFKFWNAFSGCHFINLLKSKYLFNIKVSQNEETEEIFTLTSFNEFFVHTISTIYFATYGKKIVLLTFLKNSYGGLFLNDKKKHFNLTPTLVRNLKKLTVSSQNWIEKINERMYIESDEDLTHVLNYTFEKQTEESSAKYIDAYELSLYSHIANKGFNNSY